MEWFECLIWCDLKLYSRVALLQWELRSLECGMPLENPYFKYFFLSVQLWIQRINYATKEHSLSYSRFMYNLVKVRVLCEMVLNILHDGSL